MAIHHNKFHQARQFAIKMAMNRVLYFFIIHINKIEFVHPKTGVTLYVTSSIKMTRNFKNSRLHKVQILQRLWLPLFKNANGGTFVLVFLNLCARFIRMSPLAYFTLEGSAFILFCISLLPSTNSKVINLLNQERKTSK